MPSKRLVKDPERYKTVLCMTWANTGACPYGRKCQFAHGKEELRSRPSMQTSPPQGPAAGRPLPPLSALPMGMGMSAASSSSQLPMPPLPNAWAQPPLPMGPPPLHAPSGFCQSCPAGSGASVPLRTGAPPLPPGQPPPLPSDAGVGLSPAEFLDAAAASRTTVSSLTGSLPGSLPASLPASLPGSLTASRRPSLSTPTGFGQLPGMPPPHAPPPQLPGHRHPLSGHQLPSQLQGLPGFMSMPIDSSANRYYGTPQDAAARAPSAADAYEPPDYRNDGVGLSCCGAPPTDYDELACLAMKCLTTDDATATPVRAARGGVCGLDVGGSEAHWSPYRCDPVSHKIEYVDSPVDPREPSLGGRKDVSFSTQMVRRAVSFIFEERENSPVSSRRNTAIAA